MSPLLILLLAPLVAAACTLAVTPLVQRAALRWRFIDRPSPRRAGRLKPRLGGTGIYLGMVAALAVTYPLLPHHDPAEPGRVAGLLAGGLVVLIMGAIDDRLDLPALPQLAGQMLAAGVAVASGIVVDHLTNPLDGADGLLLLPHYLAVFATFFWLLGAMNTLNFLDGVDGLAAGITAVAAAVLAVHSLILGQVTIALLPLALLGACLGFLPYNFYPSRLTMGTSGSMFLGFAVGALAVIGGTKAATLLLVLGIPVVDTGWAIVRRLSRGQSPFQGDRGHLHHRLLAIGFSERRIVLLMYALSAALGFLALELSTGLAKLYAIGIMAVAFVGGAVLLAHLARRRVRHEPLSIGADPGARPAEGHPGS